MKNPTPSVIRRTTDEDVTELNNAFVHLLEQLRNPDTRKQLKNLLPSIVDKLIIDLVEYRYQVKFTNGKTSEWVTLIR